MVSAGWDLRTGLMYVQPTPFHLKSLLGGREDFYIHPGYEIRIDAAPFDDTPFQDEFQKEIYEYARKVADESNFSTILDIGCGSGFKLIANFFDKSTIGLDLAPTVDFLKRRWPGRTWYTPEEFISLPSMVLPAAQMVICSDVVEHVADPDELMAFIRKTQAETIILSTPERDELCLGTHNGPPHNIHHVREWNFSQFHAYVSEWFDIQEHFVIQATQCVKCCIRPLGTL